MLRSLLRDRLLLVLLSLAILLRLFSLRSNWVETYYSQGFYPWFSKILRLLTGWIPFSVGDLLYIAAFVFLVLKVWKLLSLLARRKVKEYLSWILLAKYLKLVLWIYLLFNLEWGLNYNRNGIASQLGMKVGTYSSQDLLKLAESLRDSLNHYAGMVDSSGREMLNSNNALFQQGREDYRQLEKRYPFLAYPSASLKPSLYGNLGKYFGYTGYYNPFSGEAQVKTSIPVFMKSFIVNHEIAHQLGYAREDEASFVSFLAGRQSPNPEVRYSTYYELYYDAISNLAQSGDLKNVAMLMNSLHPQVRADLRTYRDYLRRIRNPIQPFMTEAYNQYLKINSQPKGMATYREVVALLIAYQKKFGRL